uniref:Uncharacterized protein n=1 Tax=Arundo donax TaxID=35708 RepID=A0A0A8Z2D9_ARUDO
MQLLNSCAVTRTDNLLNSIVFFLYITV